MMKRLALFTLLLFAIPASAAQRGSTEPATQTISPVPSFRPVTQERLLNSDAEPENIDLMGNFAIALAYAGDHEEAAMKGGELRDLAPENQANLYNVACCYALCARAVGGQAEDSSLSGPDRESRGWLCRLLPAAVPDRSVLLRVLPQKWHLSPETDVGSRPK